MALNNRTRRNVLIVDRSQPLYATISPDNPDQTIYFTLDPADDEGDGELSDESLQKALVLAGVWSDLDWDEAAQALDEIRHSSPPTPPIDDESLGLK